MNPASTKSSFYFLIAFILLATCFSMLLVASLVFLLGGSISLWQFPLSILSVYLLHYFVVRFYFPAGGRIVFFKSVIIHIVILGISMVLSGLIYDLSYDGQAYHQETIYHLKNGWNPVYQTLSDSVYQSTWINHYAKGAEIPQAVIYSFTGRIETGKCTNILLATGTFFLGLSFLGRVRGLSSLKIVLISLLAVFNPVTINQINTYYIDGQIACLLLALLLSGCLIIVELRWPPILLFCTILLVLLTSKFTAIPFAGIFILGLIFLLLIRREQPGLLKVSVAIAVTSILAVAVVGFNPYLKNTFTKGHPFYPLITVNQHPSIDIMKGNSPVGFPKMNRFEKFYLSFFAHSENIHETQGTMPRLKIPFTFDKKDLVNTGGIDTRMAGFGFLFSGIMLVALMLMGILFYKDPSTDALRFGLYGIGVLIASAFIIPEPWWARYVPQLWLVPLVVLVILEVSDQNWSMIILSRILWLALVINILVSLLSFPRSIVQSIYLNFQLRQLKSVSQPVRVNWGYSESNRIRFQECEIKFMEEEKLGSGEVDTLIASGTRFKVPDGFKPANEPPIIIWIRKITGSKLR